MEYRSVSSKMPVTEVSLFKDFCQRKGVTPAALIRELILREMGVPMPHTVAGRNRIVYERGQDRFSWAVELDNGVVVEVLGDVSPGFLEELGGMVNDGLDERAAFIGKVRGDSVAVPSGMLRGRK